MEEGGLFSGRNLLIIAVVAAAAYFLFFRGKKSSSTDPASGGGSATQTTGDTNIQSGAITITVSDNTTAQKGKGDSGSPPTDGTGGSSIPTPQGTDDQDPGSGEPRGNPQPRPPVRPPTVINGGLNGRPTPTSRPAERPSNTAVSRGTAVAAARPIYMPPRPTGSSPAAARKHPPVRRAPAKKAPVRRRKPVPRRRQPGTLGFGR